MSVGAYQSSSDWIWSGLFGRALYMRSGGMGTGLVGEVTRLDDLPKLTMRTFIGIVVAVSGNVLISLALNLQKLAHRRVEEMKNISSPSSILGQRYRDQGDHNNVHNGHRNEDEDDVFSPSHPSDRTPRPQESELQPLASHPEFLHDYGTDSSSSSNNTTRRQTNGTTPKRSFVSRFNPLHTRPKKLATPPKHILPVDTISEDAPIHSLATIRRKPPSSQNDDDNDYADDPDAVEVDYESHYLKSKLWWTGFLLMNVGETGNFISYAFAPASMVAPLGTFALMANCFFAPLLLGEHFKIRDLFGVIIAIIGAVTVVLASNPSDTGLDSDALLRAIASTPFIAYSCVYIAGAIFLATLSEGEVGKSFVFVDVGLCALFGGFTVLSTKALSTLLTLQWIDIFRHRLSYILFLILVLTGVGQIRYLNRALKRFDSKVVIPIQFVFFTLSAIIGSAILYGDFRKARFHEVVTFLYGCTATFAGVFIIAWSPKNSGNINNDGGEVESVATEDPVQAGQEGVRVGTGSIGRKRRVTLGMLNGVRQSSRDPPPLRHRKSTITTMGISPAQHLLLVHSPPRDIPSLDSRLDSDDDVERGSVGSYGRRRTMSWYGSDRVRHENGDARDSFSIGRR